MGRGGPGRNLWGQETASHTQNWPIEMLTWADRVASLLSLFLPSLVQVPGKSISRGARFRPVSTPQESKVRGGLTLGFSTRGVTRNYYPETLPHREGHFPDEVWQLQSGEGDCGQAEMTPPLCHLGWDDREPRVLDSRLSCPGEAGGGSGHTTDLSVDSVWKCCKAALAGLFISTFAVYHFYDYNDFSFGK